MPSNWCQACGVNESLGKIRARERWLSRWYWYKWTLSMSNSQLIADRGEDHANYTSSRSHVTLVPQGQIFEWGSLLNRDPYLMRIHKKCAYFGSYPHLMWIHIQWGSSFDVDPHSMRIVIWCGSTFKEVFQKSLVLSVTLNALIQKLKFFNWAVVPFILHCLTLDCHLYWYSWYCVYESGTYSCCAGGGVRSLALWIGSPMCYPLDHGALG